MFEDSRGHVDDAVRGLRGQVHTDDAKLRHDETGPRRSRVSRVAAGPGRAAWSVPVVVAGAFLAVVVAIVAVTSLTGDDGAPSSGAGEAGPPGDGSGASAGTTYTGDSVFNFEAPNGLGTATVSVACGETCTVRVDEVAGHNDAVRGWVKAALEHTYTSAGSGYAFAGGVVSSCAQVEDGAHFADPELWSAELTRTEDGLVITAVLEAFDGAGCGSSRTELTYTGSAG